ncbi:MAG TPA: peptidylprolyl isomerase [Pirellulales bacterium]|nr:peptidylprolyl isomerase [Pirellulales bacterium]
MSRPFGNYFSASSSGNRRRAKQPALHSVRLECLESRWLLTNNPIVTVDTNLGSFQIELFPAYAPVTVANFLTYVTDGAYSDTVFDRSEPGNIEQAGGYLSQTQTFNGSTSQFTPVSTNAPIALEYDLPNVLGSVAMARGSDANSATSQWFVNLGNNTQEYGQGNGGGYAVFGQVIDGGMAVLNAISALPTTNVDNNIFSQLPLAAGNQLVRITSVTVDSVDGSVFTDVNGNGVFDSGEPPLAGRTVFINRDGSGVPDANNPSTSTDSNGNYSFSGLLPGTYTVEEVLPANASLTTPMQTVTVAANQTASDVDFGERTSIVGTVFQDANGNGQLDSGEIPVSGRTVFIDNDNSGVPDANNPSATTNASGLYYFANLPAGTYTVTEIVPSGVTLTTPATRSAVVQSGMTALNVNFGEQPPPLTNNEKYVALLFLDLLHRQAEPSGDQYWGNLLTNGQTRPQVALEIEHSQEYLNDTVTALFETFLHRAPEPAALTAYSGFLGTGGTPEQIEIGLASSAEYYQVRGGGTNQGFLNALFSDALHRPADAGAVSTLSSIDLSNQSLRTPVVSAIFGSNEYLQDLVSLPGAPSASAGFVEYGWYQAYLDRDAEAAAIASAVGALRAGVADSVYVANIIGSQEFYNLAQSEIS